MATIQAANNEKVFSIAKWGGLNEHPDGDTRLKLGEASKMINWKITRDGNLKRRPGREFICGLCRNYNVEVSPELTFLNDYHSPSDTVDIYMSASGSVNPGTIVLVGTDGKVEHGVYTISAEIVHDVLCGKDGTVFTVADGVASVSGSATKVTISQLAAMIAQLTPGAYLYTRHNETPYAINGNCLAQTGSVYRLSGYAVRAVADVLTAQPIAGLWAGMAGNRKCLLAACDGAVWNLYDSTNDVITRTFIGNIRTDKGVNFIPFDGKVYIQNGYEYYVYNGSTLSTVTGYRPLIAIAIGPIDSGSESASGVNIIDGVMSVTVPEATQASSNAGELTGEHVNLLNGYRRVWLSPDGENASFQLPEKDLWQIDWVKDLATGTSKSYGTDYTYDITNGTITFTAVPTKAVNSYEVGYTVKTHANTSSIPDYRGQVTGNLYAELYSGQTDTMLCFYGDGTNRVLYTGMDYNGMPRADYFPDQYEARIGDSNTPVTSLIRHYAALLAFKPGEAWACNYGQTELANGILTPALYITPVNRDKGNDAPGQVRLVNNNPVTCSGGELYHWTNSSYYTSNLTRDERQAKRISDRIQRSIKEFDLEECCMWDDNDAQEFYISQNGVALVWNYATDTWYRYENFDAVRMCNFQGSLIFGTSDGKLLKLSDDVKSDEGYPIEAEWESGAMDFGAGNLRKYSSMLWVGLKPEDGTYVNVCVETDRKNTFREKVVSSTKAKVPGEPFMVRSKIKAKKFVYYRLLLSVNEVMPAVTVTNVDFRVRQTGYAK